MPNEVRWDTCLPRNDCVHVAAASHRSFQVLAHRNAGPHLLSAFDRGEHNSKSKINQVDVCYRDGDISREYDPVTDNTIQELDECHFSRFSVGSAHHDSLSASTAKLYGGQGPL